MAKRRASGTTFIQRSRRVPSAEKAAFHNLTGAGKAGTTREFLGLTKEDEDAIFARVEEYIARTLLKD